MNTLAIISTDVNPDSNGGESLTITTEFLHDGHPNDELYLNQTITLHSYCNSASFNLCGAILTPEVLREMADEIEHKIKSFRGVVGEQNDHMCRRSRTERQTTRNLASSL